MNKMLVNRSKDINNMVTMIADLSILMKANTHNNSKTFHTTIHHILHTHSNGIKSNMIKVRHIFPLTNNTHSMHQMSMVQMIGKNQKEKSRKNDRHY
jgi:hypothetical protein